MQQSELVQKHPWLARTNLIEEYLPPAYYQHLLKPYAFDRVSDLQLLERFAKKLNASAILELGCGSGRASSVVVDILPSAHYTFSDLSTRMLEAAKEHLPQHASFVREDAIDFMAKTNDRYDFVYTLWSFSHSVHQHIHRLNVDEGGAYVRQSIKKFIRENLKENGAFFLVHFDSLSQEQRILMNQWKRVFPAFSQSELQSPSKRIIDEVLLELDNIGEVRLSIDHLQGDPIPYESEDELLETFMNFHLETYFNTTPFVADVIDDIKKQAARYRNANGSYSIAPGCYVYTCIKN